MPNRHLVAAVFLFVTFFADGSRASAADRLCDPSFENCRTPLLDLIRAEEVGIDVAFWFMEDARYSAALIEKWRQRVPVRIIMDTEANANYPLNASILSDLKAAGIPMLEKTSSGIVHWKMMLFAGQNVVEFSGANFSPHAFVASDPYVDYLDEVIVFSDDPAIVESFKRKYDDVWITTTGYTPYGNITGTRTRNYPLYSIDPRMNFVPFQNFATRSVGHYDKETAAIDSIMFRITDRRHTDALIAAMGRGVPVRLVTDEQEYRDPTRLWHAWNVDRLYSAGAQVKLEAHRGSLHQKSTLMHGQNLLVFGSSNWTSPSARSQLEHNLFTTDPMYFEYFRNQFERKWNNQTGNIETRPLVPLPPDAPRYVAPADAAQNQPATVTLEWYAGPWAHVYDIYFGTDPSNLPLHAANQQLGPSEHSRDYVRFTVSGLQESTTYYWRVVSKTMANVERGGTVWSFRTTGEAPTAGDGDVVLYAAKAATRAGRWVPVADTTAASGARMETSNNGVKLAVQANPTDYFEMGFLAEAGVPYRLWLRGKAASNNWANDSAFVQFSDSVTASGNPVYRIGSTSATTVTIEDCVSCGLSGWGWNDNAIGAGVLGPEIFFQTSGEHRVRVQLREDGLSIDQIVLSRGPFLTTAPGATKNDGTILLEAGGTTGGGDPAPPPAPLPTGWQSHDIGAVGTTGSASESGATFTVRGAGADVWGTADAFHYAYRSLSGDGTITARVSSVGGSEAWTKVGVMIRASSASNAAHAFMLVSTGKGLAFQRRTSSGATSVHTSGGSGTAPRWVRLRRTGNAITASVSSDGASWTEVGSDTFTMPADVLVGLAVSSHSAGVLATGTFDHVAVDAGTSTPPPPPTALPTGWESGDIGAVGAAGSASESSGTFTVTGGGEDVWGTVDAFHFAYRALPGDGTITARVASLSGSEAWTKVGVMIRGSTSPQSAHAFILVSAAKGIAFQRRTADANVSTHTSGGAGVAPKWVRLTRGGNSISAYVSTDGVSWFLVGSDTFAMPADALVGLAVTSHDSGRLATGTFQNVTVS
jgi:phosphatidylserine/phosphatidylglycerophosphate/cardiolipin synthase-like enzyme/regulation of enolase protein 1 (concanavalin A-like superfamily)